MRDAVEQLRALHAVSEGEYRPRAALQLGLVIADLVAELPDDDHRLPELIEEGLQRLDDGMDIAPAAAQRAKEVLSGRRSQWRKVVDTMQDLDPGQRRRTMEAALFLLSDADRAKLRPLLSLLDTDIMDGIQAGQWKPEYDAALAGWDSLEAQTGTMDPEASAVFRLVSQRLHEARGASIGDSPQATVQPEPAPTVETVWPSGTDLQQFRRAWADLGPLVSLLPDDAGGGPMRAFMEAAGLMDAFIARRWTAEQEQTLAELRRLAADLAPDDPSSVWVRASVALALGIRCRVAQEDPRPEEWPDVAEIRDVIDELEDVLALLPDADPHTEMMAGTLRAMTSSLLLLLNSRDRVDQETSLRRLARAREHAAKVPPEILAEAGEATAHIERLERLITGDTETDEGSFGGEHSGSFDAGPLDLGWLTTKVLRVRRGGNPAELAATIDELRTMRRGLPAGHPDHGIVLTWLADLLGRHSAITQAPEEIVDALEAGIEAVRVAAPNQLRDAVGTLASLLGNMVARDQRVGPFEPAEAALVAAADRADPDDAKLRIALMLGLAGARSLRARATGAEDLRRRARDSFVELEKLLGEPSPTADWVGPMWLLVSWTASQAMLGGDTDAGALAIPMAERLERVLLDHPDVAEKMSGQFTGPNPLNLNGGQGVLQMLRTLKDMVRVMAGSGPFADMLRENLTAARFGAPHPSYVPPTAAQTRRQATEGLARGRSALGTGRLDDFRAACDDLHAALSGGLEDNSLRQQVNGTLGHCLAELYRLGGKEDQVLGDAIGHLDRALASSEHTLPTVERAELMDVLARCYRESAERGLSDTATKDAERTVRAALRELARCVLVAQETEAALDIAARANEIVARAVGWCLADDRPAAAAEIAEAGRSLVLASTVLSGRVAEVLRGAGEDELADGWQRGDTEGKLLGLTALWQTRSGGSLLDTPKAQEITALLIAATAVDGLVYLVPPVTGTSDARALIFRAGLDGRPDVVDLSGVVTGTGTPLGNYLAAFGAALDEHDSGARNADGFRGTRHGRAWAQALDELGEWTHEHLLAPLVKHAREWKLGRTPHLALVPLGELAAIPFAAAWSEDPGGDRRFTINDLVLTQAVSARLLGEVARRQHQPLTERVVFAPDPTGEFPYARAIARALAERLYPEAEVYGRQSANGPASTERILTALPGGDRQGASLFHLSTHATTEPTARLRTADGWLAVSRILEQARDRDPEAPGGLIITNACLTDSTRGHYDESVTLATALLAAGATGVIGTRWPVDDDTTATVTYHLHHRLAAGNLPAEALRLAQLDMLDGGTRPRPGLHRHLAALPSERLAHPASWAAFTYHGT